jgi:hypothetical protein
MRPQGLVNLIRGRDAGYAVATVGTSFSTVLPRSGYVGKQSCIAVNKLLRRPIALRRLSE